MDNDAQNDRQMHQGNWTCSGCNGTITELPFEPDPARTDGLLCRDCHRAKRDEMRANRPQRQMFQGNWSCAGCGGAITELPFEPDPARSDNLKCRDCFKSNRSNY